MHLVLDCGHTRSKAVEEQVGRHWVSDNALTWCDDCHTYRTVVGWTNP